MATSCDQCDDVDEIGFATFLASCLFFHDVHGGRERGSAIERPFDLFGNFLHFLSSFIWNQMEKRIRELRHIPERRTPHGSSCACQRGSCHACIGRTRSGPAGSAPEHHGSESSCRPKQRCFQVGLKGQVAGAKLIPPVLLARQVQSSPLGMRSFCMHARPPLFFFWAAASASPQLPSGPWCWMEHSGSISQVEGEMSAGLHVASPGDAIAAQAIASRTADV